MKRNRMRAALCGLVLGLTATLQAEDYLYVFKDGIIRHREVASNVDSVAMEKEKSMVTLYDKQKNVLYQAKRSDVDSITFQTDIPQADLLDVQFNDDGTAVDVSPSKKAIQKIGTSQSVFYSETYKRNLASFTNPWGGTGSGYYKVDFESDQSFRNALADGHTLEVIVMPEFTGTLQNVEAKPFSAMEGGGTGFLVSTISGSRQNELTFLPNVTTSGASTWRWATSGVIPQSGVYYHMVGIWNKEEQKAYVYVNGELKNTVDAPGEMRFANSGNNWFAIGGDPSNGTSCASGWMGNVVLARVYDAPLDADQVALLWDQVHRLQETALPDMVSNISFYNGLPVSEGTVYQLFGTGFQEGDVLQLTSLSTAYSVQIPVTLTEQGCSFVIPKGMQSGSYRMTVIRGERNQMIGSITLEISDTSIASYPGMKVIAHRGYWNIEGSAQNSRASLQKAFDQQCYGSETDVWITTDGHVMVNHDASFNGVTIQTSKYAACKNLTLSNGEKMPELYEFLEMLQQEDSTKLIIEIKTHSDSQRGKACCDSVIDQVARYGLQDKVEYIGFSLELCRELVARDPQCHVAYLNGDIDPATLYKYGIMGLDYTAENYRSHPTWVANAHKLGMTTNVWTVDDTSTMIEMTKLGIDYITTNAPVEAKDIYAYFAANYQPSEDEGGSEEAGDRNLMLDIQFNQDGTVQDVSAWKNAVKVISADNQTVPVEYNEEFKSYEAHFDNTWGGTPTTYCKVDYADNTAFKVALADGHTLEAIFRVDYDGSIPNKEAKPFSSHQGGGTGFLISKTAGTRQNEITFLPNVSTDGKSLWRWATSGVVPESGTYYHVVGVWNQEEGMAYIYVNGELKNSVKAVGEFNFPSAGSNWFGIGCDPTALGGEASANWRIVKARIYDNPMTADQVSKLW